MIDKLIEIDRFISLVINNGNSVFVDHIMMFVSKVWVWVPLYAFVIILLLVRLGFKKGMVAVAMLALAFLITDQSSSILKDTICRLRPFADPDLKYRFRLLERAGGLYGFPSGHACSTFCFALLSSLIIRKIWWTIPSMAWAGIISYSRIYVAKHFFGDVICGILLGAIVGVLIHFVYKYVISRLKETEALDRR